MFRDIAIIASRDVAIAEVLNELVDDWRANRAAAMGGCAEADTTDKANAAPTKPAMVTRIKTGMITRIPGQRRSRGCGKRSGERQCRNRFKKERKQP